MTQYRVERKYLCDQMDFAILHSRLKQLLAYDPHANAQNANNTYHIKSLYFDDYTNSGFYENEAGVSERKKFRFRYYNENTDRIRLEIKSKYDCYTHKDSCPLSLADVRAFTDTSIVPHIALSKDTPKPYAQLLLNAKLNALKPVAIVEYTREPFIYKAGNVRITLDQQITCSSHTSSFLHKTLHSVPLLPQGQFILEVKYDEFLPSYIQQALELKTLQQISFSKYYLSRLCLKESFLHARPSYNTQHILL